LKTVNKKKVRNWIIIIVAILIIVGVAYVLAFNSSNKNGKYDDFAKCLTEKNVTMYGTWWCPHCKDQKELFGKSWQYVNYIECSTPDGNAQLPVCTNAGIEGYPTWELGNGSRIDKVISLKYLSGLTDCTLP
jgi:glutaredoxin